MPRDLSEAFGWLDRLERKVSRIFSGAFLENASVTNGMLRFIGGVLRLDSGALLEIIGKLRGVGDFLWSGKWKFDSGDGEIAGNVKMSGIFSLLGDLEVTEDGKITVGGIVIEPLGGGRIRVGEKIVIDAASNSIRVGDDIVIDGATGLVKIGDMILDPTENGGMIKFPGGGEVYASNGTLSLYSSSIGAYVTLSDGAAELHGPGVRWIRVDAGGIQFVGLPTKTETETGLPAAVMHVDGQGRAFRIVPG